MTRRRTKFSFLFFVQLAISLSFSQSLYASPPTAPSGLGVASAAANSVELTWVDNSNNEFGFKIERSVDDMNFFQIAETAANTVASFDTRLTAGRTYYYRVRAYNGDGNSAYTLVASTSPSAAPSGPSNL